MKEDNKLSKSQLFDPPKGWLSLLGLIALLVSIITITGYIFRFIQWNKSSETPTPREQMVASVNALGRLEPRENVIKLAAPPNLGGSKLMELFVKEGQWVKKDETIGLLDNYPRKLTEVALAQEKVKVAQANLEIVKAGAKQGEINAQQATIERLEGELNGKIITNQSEIARLDAQLEGETLENLAIVDRLQAELNNAQQEFNRYHKLAQEGVISIAQLERYRLTLDTATEKVKEANATYEKTLINLQQQIIQAKAQAQETNLILEKQIAEAKANLARIKEIRPVDIQKAQAELNQTLAELKQAQEDLDLAYIKASVDGKVLKINTYPGENVDQATGIIELGQTDQMVAIAEVYESEISQVKIGQRALILSESGAFSAQLEGEVIEIGQQIGKKDILNTDPAADVDARVVEVKILLEPESSELVSNLTYSKVIVKILL
jgi:HlyD family secretion protein